MKLTLLILSMIFALSLSAITIGEVPKNISLSGKNGGLVKSGDWNSNTIKDKVIVMFYVDPDEKDTNSHFSKKLKERHYNEEIFASIAMINLAATWKPNFIIESILKEKQKEFPRTLYVKDKKSVLVKAWEIDDDASDIILFSKEGKVLFYKSGKMSEEDMTNIFKLIEDNL